MADGDPPLQLRLHVGRFEPLEALAEWHRALGRSGTAGAAECHFIGRVRASDQRGEPLESLELEHYPGMTEAQIERLAADAGRRHRLRAVRVDHRVGLLLPGEPIVLVAVLADRRGAAQRGCHDLLEGLKHEAPFWKREWSRGTGTWLNGNTPL